MLDESTRAAIALKKFSLISPVINGQMKNNMEYYIEATKDPVDLPHYGARKYAPKTLESWYGDYMKGGIDALKPSPRGDRGNHRKITGELKEKILGYKTMYPKAPSTVIYDLLVKEGIINPSDISNSTVYRFLKNSQTVYESELEEIEEKRFSHQYPGELWQTDLMYGPYVKNGKRKEKTFLSAFIDDATRLITHAQFYHSQNFEILRHSFKEAVLKRGIPRLIYTDNGKIYRSQQFEWMCASLGCTLIHSKPFEPKGRGKIERFFRTVRTRFLSGLNADELSDIGNLNNRFSKWLNDDYQKKPHSSLNGLSPLDAFMNNISMVNMLDDPSKIKEKFYLRIKRKVHNDATLSINNFLYETDSKLANTRVEVRYEDEWIGICSIPLLIFVEDKFCGEARLVNFHDNAHMKRKGQKKNSSNIKEISENKDVVDGQITMESIPVEQTISFKSMETEVK